MAFSRSKFNRKHPVISGAEQLPESAFDNMFYDYPDKWEEKARKLQVRRWRRIKHQLV